MRAPLACGRGALLGGCWLLATVAVVPAAVLGVQDFKANTRGAGAGTLAAACFYSVT